MKLTRYICGLAALTIYGAVAASANAQLYGELIAGEVSTVPGTTRNLSVDAQGRVLVVGAAAGGSVYGPDAINVAPSNPPLFMGCQFTTAPGSVTSGRITQVSCDANGRVLVAGSGTAGSPVGGVITVQGIASGTPQPISGTVAATQSGAWNVTNVTGTVSLPTGAATAAKQPALGVAGTPSSDVLSIQGVTGMTPVNVVDQGWSGNVAASFSDVDTTSNQVVGANSARRYLLCQSYTTNTAPIYVRFNLPATVGQGAIELLPGGSLAFDSNFMPVQSLNAISTVDNQILACTIG